MKSCHFTAPASEEKTGTKIEKLEHLQMQSKKYYVYILFSISGVLYIGFTNDLKRRIWEHKQGSVEGFTKKYNVKKLVYYEITEAARVAIEREKQLKKWRREKKVSLIEKMNPHWKDLYFEI